MDANGARRAMESTGLPGRRPPVVDAAGDSNRSPSSTAASCVDTYDARPPPRPGTDGDVPRRVGVGDRRSPGIEAATDPTASATSPSSSSGAMRPVRSSIRLNEDIRSVGRALVGDDRCAAEPSVLGSMTWARMLAANAPGRACSRRWRGVVGASDDLPDDLPDDDPGSGDEIRDVSVSGRPR